MQPSCTGYRYYSASVLPRLHRILALKGLGMPGHLAIELGVPVTPA